MSKVQVFHEIPANLRLDYPQAFVTKHEAKDMLERGIAIRLSKCAILLEPYKPSPKALHASDQCESVAIEKHRHFVTGGLVRTERRPAKLSRYKAARVGH